VLSIIIERAAGRMGLGYVSQGVGLPVTHYVELLTTGQEKQPFDVRMSVHRCISVEKKINQMVLNALVHLYSAQHVSATYMTIIRSSNMWQ